MEYIFVIMSMAILTVEDIRKKKINVALIVLHIISCLTTRLTIEKIEIWDMLLGILPGALILVLSKITRGGIGVADGFALLGIGLVYGITKTILIFFAGLILSSLFGTLVMCVKKINKKSEMPFIPFMFVGTVLWGVI